MITTRSTGRSLPGVGRLGAFALLLGLTVGALNAAGTDLLTRAVSMAGDTGLRVTSVDVTIVIEQPSLAPYKDEMRKHVAACCAVDASEVSIKATTTDGLGLVGRGEGAAALAVAMLDVR